MNELLQRVINKTKEAYEKEIFSLEEYRGQTSLLIKPEKAFEILLFLKNCDAEFDVLMDLCGLDYNGQNKPERFCVAYHLYSLSKNIMVRVKAFLPESNPKINSVMSIWKSADWAEREAFDMYGIIFANRTGLKRLLLPENYGAYPLRKEYPLQGIGERYQFEKYKD